MTAVVYIPKEQDSNINQFNRIGLLKVTGTIIFSLKSCFFF